MKVCGNSVKQVDWCHFSKSIISFCVFVLSHVGKFLIFQFFSLLYVLRWSVINDLWCYYSNSRACVPVGHLYVFFGKKSSLSISWFFKIYWIACAIYIVWILTLLIICFLQFHSLSFILPMVSFAVKKLLSLIRFSLFNFALFPLFWRTYLENIYIIYVKEYTTCVLLRFQVLHLDIYLHFCSFLYGVRRYFNFILLFVS